MASQNSSSSSSTSVNSKPISSYGEVNGHPPLAMPILAHRAKGSRASSVRMQLNQIAAARRHQGRETKRAAPTAGTMVQPEAAAHATGPRPPTQPHMSQDRAVRAAMQNPALLRALCRIDEEVLMSLGHQNYGRNNLSSARVPARMEPMRIDASERRAAVGSAPLPPTSNAAPPTSNQIRQKVEGAIAVQAIPGTYLYRERQSQQDAAAVACTMPNVANAHRGYGPWWQRAEGFVYGFPGETEVSIICNCGCRFYSLDEFYSHAQGWIDVPNPLRYTSK